MEKECKIQIDNNDYIMMLFGRLDENIRTIEKAFNVNIINRENEIKITGDGNIEQAEKVIIKLLDIIKSGTLVNEQTVNYVIGLVIEKNTDNMDNIFDDVIIVTSKGKYLKCKTLGQKKYIESMKKNEIVFGIGPAGTGKTYLAIAMAVKFLKEKKVGRIVLTRPAVEAGERLGFLPGDLQEKIDPYLRPLYDALYEIIGVETYQKYVENNIIEVAPLAYMRGRTLNDSFIILDEAQNTTPEQMKMFLTRLGYNSRIVVTGDVTQIDLPGNVSGLKQVTNILKDINGIDFVYLTHKDVVRHKLVMEIIKAYDRYNKEKENR